MDWKVYLDGEEPDLGYLRRELTTPTLLASQDDGGTFIQANEFRSRNTADEVVPLVHPLLQRLNGVAHLTFPGFREVRWAGRISDEGGHSSFLYAADTIRVTAWMNVVAAGVVTADGEIPKEPEAHAPTPMMERLSAITSHPVLGDVYAIIASTPTPKWPEFYKIYELLRQASGGKDQLLSARTGISQARLGRLTANANHPALSGPDARHAVMDGLPSSDKKLTIDEGRALIDELIQGFVRGEG